MGNCTGGGAVPGVGLCQGGAVPGGRAVLGGGTVPGGELYQVGDCTRWGAVPGGGLPVLLSSLNIYTFFTSFSFARIHGPRTRCWALTQPRGFSPDKLWSEESRRN